MNTINKETDEYFFKPLYRFFEIPEEEQTRFIKAATFGSTLFFEGGIWALGKRTIKGAGQLGGDAAGLMYKTAGKITPLMKALKNSSLSKQRIDPEVWDAFISDDSMCEYNPLSYEVVIVKKDTLSAYDGSDRDTKSDGDCYIYNTLVDAWTFGKGKFHNGNTTGTRYLTNLSQIGADLKLSYMGKDEDVSSSQIHVFDWDFTPQYTEDFQITTMATDLGDSRSFKSILGVVMNVVQSTANSAYTIQVNWRENPGESWNPLTSFSNSSSDSAMGLEHSIFFSPPEVKAIKNLQLQITGTIEGDFGINDISLLFRQYRTEALSVFKPSEED